MPQGVLNSAPPSVSASADAAPRASGKTAEQPPRLAVLTLVGLLHIIVVALLLWTSRPASLPNSTQPMLEVGWLAAPGSPGSTVARAIQPKPTEPAPQREKTIATAQLNPSTPKLLATKSAPAANEIAKPTESDSQASSTSPTTVTASGGGSTSGATSGAGGGTYDSSAEAPGFDAAYLSNPAPSYPGLSRELGEQGRVLLRVLVSAEGKAQEIEVHKSSSHERLDRAASRAVGNWRFVPGRRDGQTVAAWVIVPINFSLRK